MTTISLSFKHCAISSAAEQATGDFIGSGNSVRQSRLSIYGVCNNGISKKVVRQTIASSTSIPKSAMMRPALYVVFSIV